jgi:thiol-disulfide isomerase/thioredoxin
MRHLLFTLFILAIFLVTIVDAQTPGAAEARLRQLWFQGDGELRALEGRRFIEEKGASLETRAWYATVAANAFPWYRWPAASVIEGMKEEAPNDPWTLLAQAGAAPNVLERIYYCDKALAATKNTYILVMCVELVSSTITGETVGVTGDERAVEGFMEKYRDRFEENGNTMAAKAFGTLRLTVAREKGIPGNRDHVYQLLERALSMDPHNARAMSYRSNSYAAQKRFREIIDTLGSVLAAGERSGQLHRAYVNALNQIEMPDAEKARLIETDMMRIAESGEIAPQMFAGMLQALNNYSPDAERRVMERFLERHPGTPTAESLTMRLLELKQDRYANWTNVPLATRREVADSALAFLRNPNRGLPWAEQRANNILVDALLSKNDADPMQLWSALQLARDDYGFRFAHALLERGIHTQEVRDICKRTIDKMILTAQQRSIEWKTVAAGRLVEARHWSDIGRWYVALGDAEVRLGRLNEVADKLDMAKSLIRDSANDVELQLALARLHQAKRDFVKAEGYLSAAFFAEWDSMTEHPAIAAYRNLYLARGGTKAGVDRYLAAIYEKDRVRRRNQVLLSKKTNGTILPDFSLNKIDGSSVSSAELKGKVVVVNFWGVWCPPCREEMPLLQRIYEKYKNNADVRFVTIDSGDAIGLLKSYLAKNRYTLPVLLEGEYVKKVGVDTFPTTWFLDRDGRIAFEYIGSMNELDLELRLEALLGKKE